MQALNLAAMRHHGGHWLRYIILLDAEENCWCLDPDQIGCQFLGDRWVATRLCGSYKRFAIVMYVFPWQLYTSEDPFTAIVHNGLRCFSLICDCLLWKSVDQIFELSSQSSCCGWYCTTESTNTQRSLVPRVIQVPVVQKRWTSTSSKNHHQQGQILNQNINPIAKVIAKRGEE